MNTQPQAKFPAFEQVYTSASALLDKTHGDLGVVCETAGFPREIQADLDSLNSYQPIDALSGESSEKHPPAYSLAVRGSQRGFYAISRTIFAGADHTGRTTPLAHHVAAPIKNLGDSVAPADVLFSLSKSFLSRWNDEPRRLGQPRDVTIVNRLGAGQEFPSATWLQMISTPRAAAILGFFAEHFTSNAALSDVAVVFVIPQSLGDNVCDLLADLLAVLPASFAFEITARTHVITPPSVSGASRLMFTYENTPFLAQSRRRQDSSRPVIIDLTNGASSELPRNDYGRQIERAVIAGQEATYFQELVNLRSKMGVLKDLTGTPFSDFETLWTTLQSAKPFQNIENTLQLLKTVENSSASALSIVSNLLTKAIDRQLTTPLDDSDWQALTTLAFFGAVPRKPKQLATQAIQQSPLQAFPSVFGDSRMQGRSANQIKNRLRKIVERPDILASMIQQTLNDPNSRNEQCVRKTLFELQPSVTQDDFAKWGQILQASERAAAKPMRTLISEFLAQQIRQGAVEPLTLKDAVKLIVENCDESERQKIVFDLLEASVSNRQRREFARWITDTFGTEHDFVPGPEVSLHSPAALAEIQGTSTVEVEHKRCRPGSESETFSDRQRQSSGNGPRSKNQTKNWAKLLKSACERLPWISTMAIILCVMALVVGRKALWPPSLHLPQAGPTVLQWVGLAAFPLSLGVSRWLRQRVQKNTHISTRSTSILQLNIALAALLLGTVTTLYACFDWFR